MNREVDLMKDLKAAGEIPITSLTPEELQGALDTARVGRWKGMQDSKQVVCTIIPTGG